MQGSHFQIQKAYNHQTWTKDSHGGDKLFQTNLRDFDDSIKEQCPK